MATTTDYSKLKNAELESLLKERSLPHTGKKAEMVARLVEHDKSQNASQPPPAAAATSSDTTATPTQAPATAQPTTAVTSEPAAAAVAAGGTVRVDNPVAVPNQTQVEDPSATNDLSVSGAATSADDTTAEAPTTTETKATPATAEELKAAKEAEAAKFSSHMPATDLDAELAKRKARAKKFGIEETDQDAIKALERAKRFGTGTAGEQSAGTGLSGMKGLDEALPERGQRKRGRAGAAATEDNYEDDGLKRRRGHGRQFRGGRGGPSRQKSDVSVPKARNGAPGWMSEKDREAAEKRKARFG